jgi:hypothetical protein
VDTGQIVFGVLQLYLLWQQNRILRAKEDPVQIAESEPRTGRGQRARRFLGHYWPLVFMVVLSGVVWWYSTRRVWSPPPATACDMRIGGREYSKIASFLLEKREKGAVRTVRLLVGWGERQSCFYARDLQDVFMQNGWEVKPIEEVDPGGMRGRGVWLHSAPQDQLAEEFFHKVMCELSQERHYMPIDDNVPREWRFFVSDYGGIELPQEKKCQSRKTVTGLH